MSELLEEVKTDGEEIPCELTEGPSAPEAEVLPEPAPEQPEQEGKKPKDRKKPSGYTVGILVALVIAALLLAAFAVAFLRESKATPTGNVFPDEIRLASKPGRNVYTDGNGRYTIQGIAKTVLPSVVGVTASGGDLIGGISQGSGIILSEEGYIVTNAHVVDGTTDLTVWLADGRSFPADLVGSDPKTDLAVLKINASELIPATLGNAEELELGEPVAALGSPIGLDGTITDGIVSGLNRKIKSVSGSYRMNCIQTNAAVNPGNSGGALVNLYGQVVGVISSKYVDVNYEGIGFAISINEVLPVVEELIENGYVTGRVRIGITFRQITPQAAEQMGDGMKAGLYIVEIDPECSIASTKLQPGDIITVLDGEKAGELPNVNDFLIGRTAGETMTAEVYRPATEEASEETFTITFTLEEDVPKK